MATEIQFKEAEVPINGISQRTLNILVVADNVEGQSVSIAQFVVRQG